MSNSNTSAASQPTFGEAFPTWAKIGFLSFGGPAAQIALMHKIVVEEKGWLKEQQFLNALSFCMLLPGPEAMQLATYAGWRLHGLWGGLAAGLMFVIPGALIILALATFYAAVGNVPLVNAVFLGIKAAVLIVVVEALLRVAKRALHKPEHWIIAGLTFVAIFFFDLSYPLIVAVAAAFGFLRGSDSTGDGGAPEAISKSFLGTLATIVIWLVIWWAPIFAMDAIFDTKILADIGQFFSKLAVVTFGGAYAVLAYMAQDVVNQFGWLTAGEMMDGLGLAETTPGPLILVTEFVGFLAAYREGGMALGVAGAAVTLWVTFAPCFLWIFAGAPYIEWICAQSRLKGALTGITAAVVGVILNLSIWFALHVIFAKVTATKYGPVVLWQPDLTTFDWQVIVLSVLCGVLMFKFHMGITWILAVSSSIGIFLALGL